MRRLLKLILGLAAGVMMDGTLSQAVVPDDLQAAVALLQKKYSQVRDLKMDFVQNHRNPRRGQRTESGLLYLRRPGMMRWEYHQPVEKLFVSDGKTLSFYIPEDRQVQRGKVKESRDQRVPFLFLLGKGDLRKDFARLEWATEEKPFFKGNRALMAYPKKGGEEFAKVLMEYDPASIQLQRIIIFSLDGSRSEFIFTNIHENGGVNVSLFNFKIPAGVEVVGLEEN
jgi:outer membrane lipoprotein carrier protein